MKTMSKIEALAKKNAKKAEAKNAEREARIKQMRSIESKEELFREKCLDAVYEMREKKEAVIRDKEWEEYMNSMKNELKNESKGN